MNAASNRLRRTNPTTLYWRSMRRVQRRAVAWTADPTDTRARLLREACRVTNHLARRV